MDSGSVHEDAIGDRGKQLDTLGAPEARNEVPLENCIRADNPELGMQKFIQETPIFDRRKDDIAKRCFVPQQEAHRPQARERSALTEQKAEVISPGLQRRLAKQVQNS